MAKEIVIDNRSYLAYYEIGDILEDSLAKKHKRYYLITGYMVHGGYLYYKHIDLDNGLPDDAMFRPETGWYKVIA